MSYTPTTLVEYSWAHPPQCLAGVNAKPITSPNEDHDAFSHFELTCKCGTSNWKVVGYQPEPDLLLCPLTLDCDHCGTRSEVFDVEKHGYDAVLGGGCCSRRAEGEESTLACAKCKGIIFAATAVVSYQFEDGEFDDFERRQDIFDTFCLDVVCKGCGHRTGVCDYECA